MPFLERLAEISNSVVTAGIVAIGGGITWLVRRVLTNEAELKMLRQHLDERDHQRVEDREALSRELSEVKDSVKRIEGWVFDIKR